MTGVIALALFGALLALVHEAPHRYRRTERWQAAALAWSLSFSREVPPRLPRTLNQFYRLVRADWYKVSNVLQGEIEGGHFFVFDVTYVVTSRSGRPLKAPTATSYHMTCLLFHSQQLRLPPFTVTSSINWYPRMLEELGDKVKVAAPPPFHWAYLRRGKNGEHQFTFPRGEWVAYYDEAAHTGKEGAGQWLVYGLPRRQVLPEKLGDFLSMGLQALHLFSEPNSRLPEIHLPRP